MHRRRVMEQSITYVGLDVHKKTVAVALAESDKRGEVREHGQIANTPEALRKLTGKLACSGREVRFCYEAGPCGYGIQRQLTAAGHSCVVVAPSLIPRRPGDRVKTDRRDAVNLAKLHRAGELTAVWVPDEAHEAMRDLVRGRLAGVRSLRQARQQLSGFLLRHGHSPRAGALVCPRRNEDRDPMNRKLAVIALLACIAQPVWAEEEGVSLTDAVLDDPDAQSHIVDDVIPFSDFAIGYSPASSMAAPI